MAVINGTSGADFLQGLLEEMNELYGLEDADTLMGGWRNDLLDGAAGDDFLWGDGGDDTLNAGSGYDVVFGGEGNDTVSGGTEGDYVSGGKGDDHIDAGRGDDVVSGNDGNDYIFGGAGRDYLFGTLGNDTIDGGLDDDYVDGGSGDDRLMASLGNDSYIGGSGFDTLDFSAINGAVSIDLSAKTASFINGVMTFTSTIDGIEQVVAGNCGLHAMGSSHDNVFVGGAGDDWMRGKGGADTYTGGEGRDTFAWYKKDVTDGMGVDHVIDFQVGQDVMDLGDFVKGGQAYGDVVRLVDTADGVLVQGAAKGVWYDIAVLDGLDLDTSGANGGAMSLADLGLMA
jgi:Ca2+-binding RTX toxin-like protein